MHDRMFQASSQRQLKCYRLSAARLCAKLILQSAHSGRAPADNVRRNAKNPRKLFTRRVFIAVWQVVNELKAKRSLILSNVGFRRQLVRFARCRGLLDPVERASRRRGSSRLEPAAGGRERTPRAATPSRDRTRNGTEVETGAAAASAAEAEETGTATEPPQENGDAPPPPPPPRNGGHHVPPTVSPDPVVNGLQTISGSLRPRPISSRRDRLLRDVDSTIEALSIRDGADPIDTSSYYVPYRPHDSEVLSSPSVPLYEQPRSSAYLPAISYTSDPVPGTSLWTSSSRFDVLDRPHSEADFRASPFVADRSAVYAAPSSVIMDEYVQYKTASVPPQFPPVAAGQPFMSAAVKPRSHYPRSSAVGSATLLDDFEEANISSFLAERNARRSARTRPDRGGGLDPRRRSASSLDAIVASPRPFAKSPGSRRPSYGPSSEVGLLLPTSAYVGRWYAVSTPGRRYGPPAVPTYVARMTSFDSDDDDPVVGQFGSVGRTIATRVTPAPGYGPRSNYARAQSASRFI